MTRNTGTTCRVSEAIFRRRGLGRHKEVEWRRDYGIRRSSGFLLRRVLGDFQDRCYDHHGRVLKRKLWEGESQLCTCGFVAKVSRGCSSSGVLSYLIIYGGLGRGGLEAVYAVASICGLFKPPNQSP